MIPEISVHKDELYTSIVKLERWLEDRLPTDEEIVKIIRKHNISQGTNDRFRIVPNEQVSKPVNEEGSIIEIFKHVFKEMKRTKSLLNETGIVKKRKAEGGDVDELHTKKQKQQPIESSNDSPVLITRGKKRKFIEEEAKQQRGEIKSEEDIFVNSPSAIQGIISLYVDPSDTIVDLIKAGHSVPKYVTDIVVEVGLRKYDITEAQFTTFINYFKNIKSLRLPGNADDSWIVQISKFLPNIKVLILSNCKNITDIQAVKNLKFLEVLELNDTCVSDISALAELPDLRRLDLSGCKLITDFSVIKNLKELEILNLGFLDNPNVMSNDINFIAELTNLRKLSLTSCRKIENFGAIKNLKNLEALELDDTNFEDADLIAELTNLRKLNLSECDKLVDISQIAGLNKLVNLDLSKTPVENIDVISGFTELECLTMSDCGIIKDFEAIAYLKNLEELDLSKTNIKDISVLAEFKKLRELDLSRCKNIKDFSVIRNFKDLDDLELSYTNIADIRFLMDLTKLTCLDLTRCNKIEEFNSISALTSLEWLYLSQTKIKDLGNIAGNIKLELLDLSKCNIDDFSAIRNLIALEELYLDGTNIVDISFVAELKKLKKLGLSYCKDLKDHSAISNHPRLKALRLRGGNMDRELRQTLKTNLSPKEEDDDISNYKRYYSDSEVSGSDSEIASDSDTSGSDYEGDSE